LNFKIPTHDKDKTLMTKTFKINEERVFYSNEMEQENFKRIEKEIFQKLDQIPYTGSENRFEYSKAPQTTGSTRLNGTTTENLVERVKDKIKEIRKQIEENNLEQ
jgi:hypothetical protein